MAGFGKLTESLQGIVTSLQQVEQQSQQAVTTLAQSRTQMKREADSIDDLLSRLQDRRGAFESEARLQLEALKIGAGDIQEFLNNFGDAVVATEDGVRRLSQLVDEADLKGIQRDVQELVRELKTSEKGIDDAVLFLQQQGGKFADTLAGWVRAVQKGEISLKQLRELVVGLEKQFGDTAFASLAEELVRQLGQEGIG